MGWAGSQVDRLYDALHHLAEGGERMPRDTITPCLTGKGFFMKRDAVVFLLLWLIVWPIWVPVAAAFPVTVTDVLGRQVTIATPPQRIVSLAPSTTEQLFAIGAGDKVVGVTTYDNYPPQVQALERVGGYAAPNISVEKILSLKPDLVVSRGEFHRPVVEAVARVGLDVLAMEPQNFAEVYATMTLLGRLTDRATQATRVVAEMQQRVAQIQAQVATIPPSQQVTVFYKAYDEPLLTAGPSTFIGHVIAMAGGHNIFADRQESYPQVSAEEVLRRNPMVILGPATSEKLLATPLALRHPGWQHLAAIKNHRIHLLDDDLVSRPGPRLVMALEAVVKTLYPDRFP
jgi:iron complex transport system substrate-binding protein